MRCLGFANNNLCTNTSITLFRRFFSPLVLLLSVVVLGLVVALLCSCEEWKTAEPVKIKAEHKIGIIEWMDCKIFHEDTLSKATTANQPRCRKGRFKLRKIYFVSSVMCFEIFIFFWRKNNNNKTEVAQVLSGAVLLLCQFHHSTIFNVDWNGLTGCYQREILCN